MGGGAMKGTLFAGLLLCTLFLSGGAAQSQDKPDKPVWTLDFIQNAVLEISGRKAGDPSSVVLMTEYKNFDAFLQSEKLLASIRERLPKSTPGVFMPEKPDDLYETVDSRVFLEELETTGG